MRRPMDRMSSHIGTPNGRRASITIGEVKGIIEPHQTMVLSGARKA